MVSTRDKVHCITESSSSESPQRLRYVRHQQKNKTRPQLQVPENLHTRTMWCTCDGRRQEGGRKDRMEDVRVCVRYWWFWGEGVGAGG